VTGRRVAVLALAAFVVASDATLVAALLRQIAGTLSISAGAGGQAVTVYAAGYAFTAPLISRAAWRAPERRLIPGALGLFAAANAARAAALSLAALLALNGGGAPRRAPRSGFRLARSLAVRSAGGPSFSASLPLRR
jgi:predicted MFS family arabinose efflux permease